MKATTKWSVLILTFFIVPVSAIAEHPLLPDPVYFLPYSARIMQAYHDQNGEYPREWRLLDFEFNYDRPKQQNKELYQQPDSEFVYKIVSADKKHFHIQALNWDDKLVYEIRNGMKEAVALPDAAVKPARLHPDTPEPKHFLPIAAAAMKAYHDTHQKYPTQWQKLEIKYSAIPYHAYSLHVRPASGQSENWRPRGCEYVYTIMRQPDDHFLIQAQNKNQEVVYEIRDGMAEAKFIEKSGPLVQKAAIKR